MRPREQQVIDLIKTRGPQTRAALAKALGCAPRTAGVYVWRLKTRGLISADNKGPLARWHLDACEHTDQPAEIARCPSIWSFAQRIGGQP